MSQCESQPAPASPDARRAEILELLEASGEQSIDTLAERFGVSGMTIRRDLQELADAGRVIRTHGGATPAPRISFEFRFLERAREHAPEKEAIATAAAALIKPGSSVLLDSSTTTLAIARRLAALTPLTVVTTSLPIASELFGREGLDVVILGGRLRKDAPDLTGGLTDNNLELLHTDVAFLGADGIDHDGRAYNQSAEAGRLLQKMAAAAQRVFAVADHSKIGRRGLMRFADLRDWAGLITDDTLAPDTASKLRRAGVRVIQPAREAVRA